MLLDEQLLRWVLLVLGHSGSGGLLLSAIVWRLSDEQRTMMGSPGY
jgi:hypothetical protein